MGKLDYILYYEQIDDFFHFCNQSAETHPTWIQYKEKHNFNFNIKHKFLFQFYIRCHGTRESVVTTEGWLSPS